MQYKFILPNADSPIDSTVLVYGKLPLEHILGVYTDFSFEKTCKLDFIDLYPNHYKFVLSYFNRELILSASIIDKVNSDKTCYLLIWSTHEPYVPVEMIENILLKNNVNLHKVVIVSSDENPQTKIKHIFADNWWEAFYRFHVKNYNLVSSIQPKDQTLEFSKKALCLNRNLRPHRVWNYHALVQAGLDDQAHISYHLPVIKQDQEKYQDNVIDYAEIIKLAKLNLSEKDKTNFEANKKLHNSLSLDNLGFVYNYQDSILSYYYDSAVSIVTESIIEKTFITEKTFKAIAHSHPFICVANQGNCNYLKQNGYQLFPEIFGVENIDNFSTAYRVYRRLREMDENILRKKLALVQDKIYHNFNHFLTRPILLDDLMYNIFKMIDSDENSAII